jgi:hypothetical protein
MPTATATTRLVLHLDGELLARLTLVVRAHGLDGVEELVGDLVTEEAFNSHQDCPECRRVARGRRPARTA